METIPSSVGLLRKLISLELDSNRLHYLPYGKFGYNKIIVNITNKIKLKISYHIFHSFIRFEESAHDIKLGPIHIVH